MTTKTSDVNVENERETTGGNELAQTDFNRDNSMRSQERGMSTYNNIPITPELLDIIKETQNVEAQLESLQIETITPTELADQQTVFHVVDAFETEITDKEELKPVIIFKIIIDDTGEEHVVMQSANSIRRNYAKAFTNYKLLATIGSRPAPMFENMQFVYDERYKQAGNTAIVLKKAKLKVVGKS